jgi:hypothetical protein
MNREERFIYLERQNSCWRMEGCMFALFMRHVSGYFHLNNPKDGWNMEDVQYAEIAGEDLNTVSVIFGGYSPNDNRIMLIPVHPQQFIMPFRNSFDMLLYDKNGNKQQSIRLKAI